MLRGDETALNDLPDAPSVPLLGDILIENHLIGRAAFDRVLAIYKAEQDDDRTPVGDCPVL